MSKTVLNSLLVFALAALALVACGSEPADQGKTGSVGTLDLPLATEAGGVTYRVLGTILIRRAGNGQVAATIEAGPSSPSTETVKLLPGAYTVEVVEGYSCTLDPEDADFTGCTYTGANPERFVISTGRSSNVLLTFTFHFDEDVGVALGGGNANITIDPVEARPCGGESCPSGERCVAIRGAEPACAKECAEVADCGSNEACLELEGESASVCASVLTTLWTHQFGTPQYEGATGVATDSSGNVLIAGYGAGTFPGQTSAGNADSFLQKRNAAGTVLWTRQFGSTAGDYALDLATYGAGNAVVVGYTMSASSGAVDVFVRTFDVSGNALLNTGFGTSAFDVAYAVAVDGDQNVLIAGYTQGTLAGQTSAGSSDVFIGKIAADGSLLWLKQFGTSGHDYGYAVATDGDGNVFLSGAAQGALPGQATSGNFDAFVRKLDADGNTLWTRQLGSDSSDAAYGVATDGAGNVLIAGYTAGTLPGQTSSGGSDAFVRKLDTDGNTLWTRQIGSAGYDEARRIVTDSSGSAAVAGYTAGALPGQVSSGSNDAFVLKLDADGSAVWTHQFGTAQNDVAHGVATDSDGNVLVAGGTLGALPGQPDSGNGDAFVLKLGL